MDQNVKKSKTSNTYRVATNRIGLMLRFTQAKPAHLDELGHKTTVIDDRGREVRGVMKRKQRRLEKYKPRSGYVDVSRVIAVVEDTEKRNVPTCVIRVQCGNDYGSPIDGRMEDVVADIEQARQDYEQERSEKMAARVSGAYIDGLKKAIPGLTSLGGPFASTTQSPPNGVSVRGNFVYDSKGLLIGTKAAFEARRARSRARVRMARGIVRDAEGAARRFTKAVKG